jgi:hypothetical protein
MRRLGLSSDVPDSQQPCAAVAEVAGEIDEFEFS